MVIDRKGALRAGDVYLSESDSRVLVRGPDGHSFERRILRPAKLYPGGLTGWCVEVGEERPPKTGEWFEPLFGGEEATQASENWVESVRTILTPLPRDEFAAHGLEPVKDDEQQDDPEAEACSLEVRAESAEADLRLWRERAEKAEARAKQLDELRPTFSEQARLGRRMHRLKRGLAGARERAERAEARVKELEEALATKHQAPEAGEVEFPVAWEDEDGYEGFVLSNGAIQVIGGGNGALIDTTPEDRAKIIRALQAVDGGDEACENPPDISAHHPIMSADNNAATAVEMSRATHAASNTREGIAPAPTETEGEAHEGLVERIADHLCKIDEAAGMVLGVHWDDEARRIINHVREASRPVVTDEMVERVAQALYRKRGEPSPAWGEASEEVRANYRADARATLGGEGGE
jgi:hypothetical protein